MELRLSEPSARFSLYHETYRKAGSSTLDERQITATFAKALSCPVSVKTGRAQ
jgi:hypothetical protein